MKTTLLLLLLTTFSAFGQNETAYTLAKKLANYDYKTKPTIEDRKTARELLSQLLCYTQQDRYGIETDTTLAKYSVLNNKYLSLRNVYFFRDSLELTTLINSGEIEKLLNSTNKTIKDGIQKDVDLLEKLINDFKQFKQIDTKINSLGNDLKQIDIDWKSLTTDADTNWVVTSKITSKRITESPGLFTHDSATVSFVKNRILELRKTIPLEIQESKKQQNDLLLKIDSELRMLSSKTCSLIFNKDVAPQTKQYLYQVLNKDIRDYTAETTPIMIDIFSGKSTGSITSKMNYSTQQEMIELAAAFLVDRVKQESILWFFDEMRENAEAYELLSIAFPETIKLLQSEETYRTPNLSVTWRSALSEDFVKMPRNVLDSNWLKEKLKNHGLACSYLSTGWQIAQYVDQRFNYREIIRQLYLSKNDSLNNKTSITPNTLIDILYAFSTELYVQDTNKTLRAISYEELRSLTAEEMDIMLSLLDMKYNQSIQLICHSKLFNGKDTLSRENANKISAWIGRFNFALNQFDKVLQEIELKEKDKNYNFSYYNVWSLMSQALMELLPKEAIVLDKPYYEDTEFYIGLLNDSYTVYDMLSKRNYAGSVSKVIDLIEALVYKESVTRTYSNSANQMTFIEVEFSQDAAFKKIIIPRNILASHLSMYGIKPKRIHKILANSTSPLEFENPKPGNEIKTPFILKSGSLGVINNKGVSNIIEEALQDKKLDPEILLIKENPASWGGIEYKTTLGETVLSFPTNSIGAMVLNSKYRKSLQTIRKLASFLNDVALSKDEETLAKVVKSYALPPGSYKQKRNSWLSVDLNAFVGIYGGYETAVKPQLNMLPDSIRSNVKSGLVYGVSAPIGISLTKTFGKRLFGTSKISATQRNNPDLIKIGKSKIKSLSGCSFTTTFTIIDLGAIVSYRFTHTDSIAPQSFKWSQFISPGLHVALSIRNTPLVWMSGIQYTPQLRRVKPITESPLNMVRLYTGLYFDLPLYNMYTKRRVYKL